MAFRLPPNPSPMDSSGNTPMDISLMSPLTTPTPLSNNLNQQSQPPPFIQANSFPQGSFSQASGTSAFGVVASTASLLGSLNPLAKNSPSPTAAHLRNRARRPSSLSLGLSLDRKPFGFGSSSPSSANINGSGSNTSAINANGAGLLPAYGLDEINGRGRASSSASSMSGMGFSPQRRSISLEDPTRHLPLPQTLGTNDGGNEETPTTSKKSKWFNKLGLQRRRIGITGQNESDTSLSARSDGRATPDLTTTNSNGLQLGLHTGTRGLEQDVEELAVDPNAPPKREREEGMPSTPPSATRSLKGGLLNGILRPAQLLKLQTESSSFLDSETRSEAAFARLVSSTSDLASRLRLSIAGATPGSSPARMSPKRKSRWEGWGSSSTNGTPIPPGGRFPEAAPGAQDGTVESDDSSDDDPLGGTASNTLIQSRPSSQLGMNRPSSDMNRPQSEQGMDIVGRSRSGSTAMNPPDFMGLQVGSYGGDSGMDLDMVSNMSSPISTPLTSSWREPAPVWGSKKRKFSAAPEHDRPEYVHAAKKRKGMSPHGSVIPLSTNPSSSDSSNPPSASTANPLNGLNNGALLAGTPGNPNPPPSSFTFPPRSPYMGMGLTMTPANPAPPPSFSATTNGGFPTTGTAAGWGNIGPNSFASTTQAVNSNTNSSPANGGHRKSGSISTMAWSRPGSASSSPLMRPHLSGIGGVGSSMPAPPGGFLLGPSMLSTSTTASQDNQEERRDDAGFEFEYPPGTRLGEYGAPITDSPNHRPMVRLPGRALHRPHG